MTSFPFLFVAISYQLTIWNSTMYQMANRHRSFQLCVSTKKGLFHTTLSLCCNKTFHQDSPFFCSVIDHSGPPRKRAPCRRLIPSVFMVTNCSFSGCSALLCLNYLLPLSSNGHLARHCRSAPSKGFNDVAASSLCSLFR